MSSHNTLFNLFHQTFNQICVSILVESASFVVDFSESAQVVEFVCLIYESPISTLNLSKNLSLLDIILLLYLLSSTKKAPFKGLFQRYKFKSSVLATIYSRPEGLPSILRRLTSVFGMGTGVTTASNHQDTAFEVFFIFVSKKSQSKLYVMM